MTDDALSDMRLRHLGFVFQNFHLLPRLTMQENIELPLHYLGRDSRAAAARAQELAQLVGLQDRLLHRPSFECFGGHFELRPPMPEFWEVRWDSVGEE